MNKKEPQAREIIKLLVQNELGFAEFYIKFSRMYDDAGFWLELAVAEKNHAQWLKALAESRDIISVSKNFLSATAIEMMIEMVKKEIDSDQKLPLREALKLSLKFEKSFAENHFFEIFTADSIQAKEVMEKLKTETADHVEKIKAKLNRL